MTSDGKPDDPDGKRDRPHGRFAAGPRAGRGPAPGSGPGFGQALGHGPAGGSGPAPLRPLQPLRPQEFSCGFLLFRAMPDWEFLLLRHRRRWDLPKGHVDPGETELQCAFRELREETGIAEEDVRLDDAFRFVTQYPIRRRDGRTADKRLVLYLGWLQRDQPLALTEHLSSAWFAWRPPHTVQPGTIDQVLAAAARHFAVEPPADESP